MRDSAIPKITTQHRFVPDQINPRDAHDDGFGPRLAQIEQRRRAADQYPSARTAVTLSILFWPVALALVFLLHRLL